MSVGTPLSRKTGSAIVRAFGFAAIAFGVLGTQVGLPWLSYRWAGNSDRSANGNDERNWAQFWRERLRFEEMLHPGWFSGRAYLSFASATVCKDQLIVLCKNSLPNWKMTELIRVNLRTGRLTTSPPLPSVEHVLSDGQTIWWLPSREQSGYVDSQPFILDGRPILIGRCETDHSLHQLFEFADSHWRETDRFALIPEGDFEVFQSSPTSDGVHLLYGDDSNLYYRTGLAIGTEEEARQYDVRNGQYITWLTERQLQDIGWHHLRAREGGPHFMTYPIGRWFDRGIPCAIDLSFSDDLGTVGFEWNRYADEAIESRFIHSPVRWQQDLRELRNGMGEMCVVTSFDGEVYILSFDGIDGRVHILRWVNGKLRLVAQRGSPLICGVCLDGGLFLSLALVIPMLLLGLLAGIVQQRQEPRLFAYGHETIALASVVRRGLARLIDQCLLITPLLLSVICHPDVMGWWRYLTDGSRDVFGYIELFHFDPNLDSLSEVGRASQWFLDEFFAVPILWWPLATGVLIAVGQIVWQGRSGRTFGKWLCGVKVVRTTLRPCGLARSLLREILLVIDSLMLLSWVPGVIVMLATRHSQRVGDLLSDTIVVRSHTARAK